MSGSEISREFEPETPFLQVAGPLFLMLAIALASRATPIFNADLLFVATIGLWMVARWQVRGCCYAFVLLAVSSVGKHAWIHDHHLFQMVLEGSVGFSLLISALASQQGLFFVSAMKQQIENRSQTIRYLEEDVSKHKETSLLEKTSLVEKLADVQSSLEEIQAEEGALQILNEVLRKSTANAFEEKSSLSSQLLQSKHQLGQLLGEIDLLQKELHRLANESELAQQNRVLFQELNAARFKEASTQLAYEALCQKVEGFENEKFRMLTARSEQTANLEVLHRQLKEQFNAKNAVLHQTRAELFHANTALQTIQMQAEEKQLEQEPLQAFFRKELEAVEEENSSLAQENEHLESLVTHLMGNTQPTPTKTVKKKVKMRPPAEQASLF